MITAGIANSRVSLAYGAGFTFLDQFSMANQNYA